VGRDADIADRLGERLHGWQQDAQLAYSAQQQERVQRRLAVSVAAVADHGYRHVGRRSQGR
jgi:hypothetical protein